MRTPSRVESDGRLNRFVLPPGSFGPGTPATILALAGNRGFDSEELIAFELGYRGEPTDHTGLDIAVFYNLYDDLRTFTPRTDACWASPTRWRH